MERWIMAVELTQQVELPLPVGCAVLPWEHSRRMAAAAILNQAYLATPEAILYPVLVSPAGCRKMLQQLQHEGALLVDATALIAEREVPLGTVVATRVTANRASIEHLGVLPAARGRGLGRTLLRWSLARLQAAGFKRVELHVTAANGPAVALYTAAGFIQAGAYEARPTAGG